MPGRHEVLPGLLTERGVVSLADPVPRGSTPQLTMQGLIDDFDRLRPTLTRLAGAGSAMPLADVRLRAPLPRPGKILACIANYMTLNTGDLIACGTNHEGLGALQEGEVVDFEIHGIGRMRLHVRDPLKRSWEKGIYMGADSTNSEAVQRNRPPSAR